MVIIIKTKKIFALITTILISLHIISQGIQIGQKCPDIEFNDIINFKNEKARLSDFLGKPLILDFWYSSCRACLESFSKLDSLRKEFQNDLQILLVTYESRQKIFDFFSKMKRLDAFKLPSIVSDTLINLLFPHVGAPYQIWIDKDGVVKALTGGEHLTRQNLMLLIDNKVLNIPQNLVSQEWSPNIPMINTDYEKSRNKLISYSYLSSYREEIPLSGFSLPSAASESIKIQARNQSIYSLYRIAFQRNYFHDNRIIFQGINPQKYKPDHKSKDNLFCFELITKDTDIQKAYKQMQEELDRHFNFESRIRIEKSKCLVLKRTSSKDKIKAKGNDKADLYYSKGELIIINIPFKVMIENTFRYKFALEVIDETGYKGRVDLVIEDNFQDLKAVNQSLAKYDLMLTEEQRDLEIIEIKEKLKK